MNCRSAILLLLLVLGGVPMALARVTANLTPNDPIYRHLETLVASGLVDSLILGQRPLAQSDVARMVDEAKLRLPPFRDRLMQLPGGFEITALRMRHLNYVEAIINYLSATLIGPPSHFHAHHHHTSLTTTVNDHERRTLLPTTGDGSIDASFFPLTDHLGGREFRDGITIQLESQHQLQLGPAVHLFLYPRLALAQGNGPAPLVVGEPQAAYLKTGFKAVEFVVGREALQWGPGYHGGLALSDHARPLDMVRITTPLPIAIPGVGHFKGTALFAYLHDDVSAPRAVLSGYRIDLQPHRNVTLGGQHLVMLGGAGQRDPNTGQAILAFWGLPFAGRDRVDAMHSYAIDCTIRIPEWRDTAVYVQWLIEDFDRQWSRMFDENGAWLVGVRLPRVTYDGGWSFRLEFTRAGASVFRDSAYVSGWSINERLLGNTAGPASHQLELIAARDNVLGTEVLLATRLTYRQGTADEWSAAFTGQFHHPMTQHMALQLTGGYEQAWNAGFVGGQRATNVLAEVGLAVSY